MAKTAPCNTDDVIDSRDVIARIEELEAEREELADDLAGMISETHTEANPTLDGLCKNWEEKQADSLALDTLADWLAEFMPDTDLQQAAQSLAEWDAENGEELHSLKALAEEGEGCEDWEHGVQLIRDDYFEQHVRELVDDCYEMPRGFDTNEWPWRHMTMDWAAAAEEAKQDYTSVEFDGVTYWVR